MVGKRIGNYRVVRQIGRGGMGAVFEAVHDGIGKRVAIKVLHPRYSHEPHIASRIFKEARALTSITHPGIVQIFDFGDVDGRPYIVMEYLEGESLAQRLRRAGPMLLPTALRICRQVASALAEAHASRVVHRDLKPGNIMIVADPEVPGGERAKVFDFGIAKLLAEGGEAGADEDTEYKTRSEILMGTPTYMSPEQCRGAGLVDERTDVYALGVMIYQMLAGRPPFVAEGDGDLLAMHIHQAPLPLIEVDPAVPPDLSGLLDLMLAKRPDQRPAMSRVALELDGLGTKASAAMLAVPAPAAFHALPTTPLPVVVHANSTSQHGAGEQVIRPAAWRRPPPILWTVAILLVLIPAGILLHRHLHGATGPVLLDDRASLRGASQVPAPPVVVEPIHAAPEPRPAVAVHAPGKAAEAPALPARAGKAAEAEAPPRHPLRRREAEDPADRAPERAAPRIVEHPPEHPVEHTAAAPQAHAETPPAAPPPVVAAVVPRPASPAPPPPPPPAADKPRTLPAFLIRKDKISGDKPSLPPALRAQLRAMGPQTLSYRVCVDRSGQVNSVSPAGNTPMLPDEDLRATLRTWRYRPPPVPFCFIEAFTFQVE